MDRCNHCGRSRAEPIIISSGGEEKAFCSAECVMLEDGGKGGLLSAMTRMRDDLVAAIEKGRQSRVITLVHRYEMKGHGGEEDQYITIDNTEDILQAIHSTPVGTRIDFVVHCPGGMVLPAEQIALALKSHRGGVSAMVPYYAMSGATLICLAADEIIMEPFSVLGPLDPQIGGFPSPSILRLVEAKPVQFISDEMLILADVAEKALAQMREFVTSLLSDRIGDQDGRKVGEYLTGGYLTHDAAITRETLRSLGLPAKLGVPPDVHRFMKMHRLVQRWSPSSPVGGGPLWYGRQGGPGGGDGYLRREKETEDDSTTENTVES